MKNLWQLRLVLDTSIVNNHHDGVLEWSMENYGERLRFTQKIITIFKSVIFQSLPKQLKTILEFKTTATVTSDNDSNQQIICLSISCDEDEYFDSSVGGFAAFSDEFERAIRELPDSINKIYKANPTHPERVILHRQNSNVTEIVQISSPLCLQLIEKMRRHRDKNFFETTVILPDSSQITFDIATIAKSSEEQAPSDQDIKGKIVEFSDKGKRFLLQSKDSKVQIVFIPSIDDEAREILISTMRSKENISVSARPTIEYIGGENKNKTYQFQKMNMLQSTLDL